MEATRPYIFTSKTGRTMALALTGALVQLAAADSFNKGGSTKDYDSAVGTDSSPNHDTNKALYDSGKGLSVFVWGPVMAVVLGGTVAWMIVAINKGGIMGALNAILALVLGGLCMSVVYTYMIAPAS
jgi:hypothetical protein